MKSLLCCTTPGFPKLGVLFLGCLLCLGHGKVWAQTQFNRWDAQPVPTPKPVGSAMQRGTQLIQVKARQDSLAKIQLLRRDSLRIAAIAAQTPPLKRGIGQRIKEGRTVSEDSRYSEYVRKTVRYPIEAMRAETQGRVVVRLIVNDVGRVVGATVVEDTIPEGAIGRNNMVQQVNLLLRQLRFEPASGVLEEELPVSYNLR